ncbi:MAG TPA: serine protease [Methylibium sp.]|nr:serine protease [Methylibium sp.]
MGADRPSVAAPAAAARGVEPVVLAVTRVATFDGTRPLTQASGFFFERDERLYLVTSRHVVIDRPTNHRPDRIEIELHLHPSDMTRVTGFSIPLYRAGRSVWHQGTDSGGEIDVAAIELERAALPPDTQIQAFTTEHLLPSLEGVDLGHQLVVPCFPLSFHDTVHHLPIARQAALASSLGLRFQGHGYFLTDARMHRGASGAPVLLHGPRPRSAEEPLPWVLLGVHSARMDMAGRDGLQDEALGLNCAWYADILLTLTEP